MCDLKENKHKNTPTLTLLCIEFNMLDVFKGVPKGVTAKEQRLSTPLLGFCEPVIGGI